MRGEQIGLLGDVGDLPRHAIDRACAFHEVADGARNVVHGKLHALDLAVQIAQAVRAVARMPEARLGNGPDLLGALRHRGNARAQLLDRSRRRLRGVGLVPGAVFDQVRRGGHALRSRRHGRRAAPDFLDDRPQPVLHRCERAHQLAGFIAPALIDDRAQVADRDALRELARRLERRANPAAHDETGRNRCDDGDHEQNAADDQRTEFGFAGGGEARLGLAALYVDQRAETAAQPLVCLLGALHLARRRLCIAARHGERGGSVLGVLRQLFLRLGCEARFLGVCIERRGKATELRDGVLEPRGLVLDVDLDFARVLRRTPIEYAVQPGMEDRDLLRDPRARAVLRELLLHDVVQRVALPAQPIEGRDGERKQHRDGDPRSDQQLRA